MEIILTNHAIDEFKRHLKTSGTPKEVMSEIANFFRIKTQLVHANSYTLPRKGKQPKFKGPATYLARFSWKSSKVLLLLVFSNGVYSAVTALSSREFKTGVKRKLITDVREEPVDEEPYKQQSGYRYNQRGQVLDGVIQVRRRHPWLP